MRKNLRCIVYLNSHIAIRIPDPFTACTSKQFTPKAQCLTLLCVIASLNGEMVYIRALCVSLLLCILAAYNQSIENDVLFAPFIGWLLSLNLFSYRLLCIS